MVELRYGRLLVGYWLANDNSANVVVSGPYECINCSTRRVEHGSLQQCDDWQVFQVCCRKS
jgi:hypothetical protein